MQYGGAHTSLNRGRSEVSTMHCAVLLVYCAVACHACITYYDPPYSSVDALHHTMPCMPAGWSRYHVQLQLLIFCYKVNHTQHMSALPAQHQQYSIALPLTSNTASLCLSTTAAIQHRFASPPAPAIQHRFASPPAIQHRFASPPQLSAALIQSVRALILRASNS